jgi:hypothetical protein
MVLESNQPVMEVSRNTKILHGSKGWLAHKAENLTTICELIV